MNKKTLQDLDLDQLRGSTVLVRADLNVPLASGVITDDQRIRASLPTLRTLTGAGARVVVLSHLGRPKGKTDPACSLAPVAARLGELLEAPVRFIPEVTGSAAAEDVASLGAGEVGVLENTRFTGGETSGDPSLAASWAALGDIFVNDAFGTAHRAHASTAGLATAMRSRGRESVAGILLARELGFLEDALLDPARPFVAIVGGAKISSKIGVISSLLPRVDHLLIGGAMANTFFRALGLSTGNSLIEEDSIETARALLSEGGERLVLPVDCVVAPRIASDVAARAVERTDIQSGDMVLDVGPKTRQRFAAMVGLARTVVWNGPMGVFEVDPFAEGTVDIAHSVARACDAGAIGILGGGDSAAAAERAGVGDRLTHVSTGGGASLELLAGKTLPGVDALTDRSL